MSKTKPPPLVKSLSHRYSLTHSFKLKKRNSSNNSKNGSTTNLSNLNNASIPLTSITVTEANTNETKKDNLKETKSSKNNNNNNITIATPIQINQTIQESTDSSSFRSPALSNPSPKAEFLSQLDNVNSLLPKKKQIVLFQHHYLQLNLLHYYHLSIQK